MTRDGKTLAAIQRTRSSDIWTTPASDSSQARQITSGEPAYNVVAPGPSGKVLATSRDGDVWLMNTDGSQAAVLVPQAHNLRSISSCGDRYVIFDSYRDGKIELWRVEADGSNGQKLADNTGDSDCSPDGKWVYYGSKDKIYRMPAEGGDPVALVSVPEAATRSECHPMGAKLPLPTRRAPQCLCRNWAWWLLPAEPCSL